MGGGRRQLYIKRALTYTPAHTEIAYSSAINLMRAGSRGAAIWIGFFFDDLLKHYTAVQARAMMVTHVPPLLVFLWLSHSHVL
jgi:hypothetical protein